jgi:heme/copper-type cytochrome/quinol oxidase subunit 3
MGLFLASLGVLFAAAIVGYLVVRLKAEHWPPPGMPRLPAGMWLATAGAPKQDDGRRSGSREQPRM